MARKDVVDRSSEQPKKRRRAWKILLFILLLLFSAFLYIPWLTDGTQPDSQKTVAWWSEHFPTPKEALRWVEDTLAPMDKPAPASEQKRRHQKEDKPKPAVFAPTKELERPVQPPAADRPAPVQPKPQPVVSLPKPPDVETIYKSLESQVNQLLARYAFDDAFSATNTFEKSHPHYWKTRELRSSIEKAKAAHRAQRLAAVQKQFEQTANQAKSLILEDRFDEARELYRPYTNNEFEEIRVQSEQALLVLEQRIGVHAKGTLPQRRELYPRLILELSPEIDRRDYLGAQKKLKEWITKDSSPYQILYPILKEDIVMLGHVAALMELSKKNLANPPRGIKEIRQKNGGIISGIVAGFQDNKVEIVLDEGRAYVEFKDLAASEIIKFTREAPQKITPLVHAWFLLYEGEFSAAAEAAVPSYDDGGDTFFERLVLVREVIEKQRLAADLARAEDLKAKQRWPELNALLIAMAARYAGSPAYEEARDRIKALTAESEQAALKAGIPASAVRSVEILSTATSSIEDKMAAIKDLSALNNPFIHPHMAKALKDESSRVRMAAIEALSKSRDKTALWTLVEAMDDPVIEVGTLAAEALTKQDRPALLNLLTQKIGSKDENERRLAALGFSTIEGQEAANTLLNATKDESWQVKKTAVVALIRLKARHTASTLLSRLDQEKHPEVKIALATALGYFQYAPAASAILKIIRTEPGNPYRQKYLKALGETGSRDIASGLKDVLKDPNPWTRYYALQAMVDANSMPDRKTIEPLLKDDHWMVRATAVTLLGKTGDPQAVKPVMELTADKSETVSYSAIQVLMNWPNVHVITEMIRNLDKVDEDVYAKTLEILTQLTQQNFKGEDKKKVQLQWMDWWNRNNAKFKMPGGAQ